MTTIQTPLPADNVAPAEPESAAGHLRQRRQFISTGGAIAAIAVTAQTLGYVSSIEHSAIEILHWSIFRNIDAVLRIGVPITIAIGVALAMYGVAFYVRERRAIPKALPIAIIVALAGSTAYASLRLLPNKVTPGDYLKAEATERARHLLAYQVTTADSQGHSTGGIRVTSDVTMTQQVWTTAQVLSGILASRADLDPDEVNRIRSAFGYMDAQFVPDQGWGYFDGWRTGVTEVAGWVCLAQIASLDHTPSIWQGQQRNAVIDSTARTLALLAAKQHASDGGWGPNIGDSSSDFTRTYSTAMATWCFVEARRSPSLQSMVSSRYDGNIERGINWLLLNYDAKLGWVPNPTRKPQSERFLGLDAQVLYVVSRAEHDFSSFLNAQATHTAKKDFLDFLDVSRSLRTNDRMHDGDRYLMHASGSPATQSASAVPCGCQFTVESSTFLWYPWSLAAARALSMDQTLSADERDAARQKADVLEQRASEAKPWLDDEYHYVTAEFLVGTAAT
jgi:hypothetical protein